MEERKKGRRSNKRIKSRKRRRTIRVKVWDCKDEKKYEKRRGQETEMQQRDTKE